MNKHFYSGSWLESLTYLRKSVAAIEERYGSDSIEVGNELNKITDVAWLWLTQDKDNERLSSEKFR